MSNQISIGSAGLSQTTQLGSGNQTQKPKFVPPKSEDNYTLRMLVEICRWIDGLEPSEKRSAYFSKHSKLVDLSALDSEPVRKQIYLLWSIHWELEELRQEKWQMSLGDNTKVIKTKISEAEKRFSDEYESYIMYLKLSSDLPVEGYYFTIAE